MDISEKKDLRLFHKEHSIYNREAIIVKSGKIMRKFIKRTNKHCFPIFPRLNPNNKWRHNFKFTGWDYYLDCKDVILEELEFPERSEPIVFSDEERLLIIPQSRHILASATVH